MAGIALANPALTLTAIATQLEAMHEPTPRGGQRWAASSVKNLLDRARRIGLIRATLKSEIPPISTSQTHLPEPAA